MEGRRDGGNSRKAEVGRTEGEREETPKRLKQEGI